MQLTIERMVYGPDGLAHTPEGKTVFVAGALAGDTVEAHVVSEEKSLVRAVADRIVEPSPERVDTPCPFVGVCGGCPWGGLSRTAQRAAKEENLKSALERIGGFERAEVEELVAPLRSSKDVWGYRNKIELAPTTGAGGKMFLGMHGRDPRQIIRVDRCPLFEKKFPKVVKAVAGALAYLGNSRDLGLERVGIRASRRTGALEIALWTPTGGFPRRRWPACWPTPYPTVPAWSA